MTWGAALLEDHDGWDPPLQENVKEVPLLSTPQGGRAGASCVVETVETAETVDVSGGTGSDV